MYLVSGAEESNGGRYSIFNTKTLRRLGRVFFYFKWVVSWNLFCGLHHRYRHFNRRKNNTLLVFKTFRYGVKLTKGTFTKITSMNNKTNNNQITQRIYLHTKTEQKLSPRAACCFALEYQYVGFTVRQKQYHYMVCRDRILSNHWT